MVPKSGQGQTLHFLLLWVFVGFLFSHVLNIFSLSPSTLKILGFFRIRPVLYLSVSPRKGEGALIFSLVMAHLLKGCDPKLSFIPLPGRLPLGEKERGMVGARDGNDFLLPLRDILMILKLLMKNHCTLSPLFSDAYNSKEYK